jgi:hypothetical protein
MLYVAWGRGFLRTYVYEGKQTNVYKGKQADVSHTPYGRNHTSAPPFDGICNPFSARKIRTRRGLGAMRVCKIFIGLDLATSGG